MPFMRTTQKNNDGEWTIFFLNEDYNEVTLGILFAVYMKKSNYSDNSRERKLTLV